MIFLSTLAALFAVLAIGAGSPIGSVVYLICTFVAAVGYLAVTGLSYVALVYLVVYVGAIAILFLFVVMMLELRIVERPSAWPLLLLLLISPDPVAWVEPVVLLPWSATQIEGVGELLFGPFASLLLVVGLLLTLGMVGPVQLCAGLALHSK
jgi:NADH:ubiquinone oxidoreductase subunit 6 (subunit J)